MKIKVFIKIMAVIMMVLIISLYFIVGVNTKKSNGANISSTSDVQLLARAINGEARGESYEG